MVIEVSNLIKITPRHGGAIIKQNILKSFVRQAIDQVKKNGYYDWSKYILTITGKVKSWSRRNSAINTAWSILIVKNVIYKIEISN